MDTELERISQASRLSWDGEFAVEFALAGAPGLRLCKDYWSGFRVYGESITGSPTYNDMLAEDYRRLCEKVGARASVQFPGQIMWMLNWLRQPETLVRRLWDEVIHPNRII